MDVDVKTDPRLNILNIANKVGIQILKPTPGAKKVVAICPFCNDTSGHLYLTIENGKYYNVYQCVKCGSKGSALQLYAAMKGLTTRDAFFELIGEDANTDLIKLSKKIIESHDKKQCFEPKDIDYLNKIYVDFIKLLPLYKHHHANLISRGLTEGTIMDKSYRSIPVDYKIRQSICSSLLKKHGQSSLEGVSGFYINDYGKWDFYAPKGMLIPSRDMENRVQLFQIRLDHPFDNKRYKNFSSSGFLKGTNCIPHVHISWNKDKTGKRVAITEGPLKADIASQFTNVTFIALPGVASLHPEAISILKELMPYKVDIAFDMDILEKVEVQRALDSLKRQLDEADFKYTDKYWKALYMENKSLKGVDDYLYYLYKEIKSKKIS